MKHHIHITQDILAQALNVYLTSRGHQNITLTFLDGLITADTEHVARQSFDASVPATCKWPHDCFIQCGDSGVVIDKEDGNYRTAFWEAFPRSPDTFLRGEGDTVQEAEQKCFAHYQRILTCAAHEFERGKYENGAGICKHCKLFLSNVFEPTEAWKHREQEGMARLRAIGDNLLDEIETMPAQP